MEEFLKLDIKKKIYYFMVMAAFLLIMVIPVLNWNPKFLFAKLTSDSAYLLQD